jgi:lysophospholipase L1-like esterase
MFFKLPMGSRVFILAVAGLSFGARLRAAETSTAKPALELGNARIVLVGDSITGLSRNASEGFAHQMDWALTQVNSNCKPNIIALGGSGQGVNSWSAVERRSRTEEFFLDVKGIPVKATLDQHADVLIIMLGMNDVLAPYVSDEPESLLKWTDTYRALIQSLQARLSPEVIALATPTLCTEDVHSPKNWMMDRLCERVSMLATEMHLLVLPTNTMMRETLAEGRRIKPDFHVTYDYVHPNEAGHCAIAMAMLHGLGNEEAARRVREVRLAKAYRTTREVVASSIPSIPLRLPLKGRNRDCTWGWAQIDLPGFEDWALGQGWPFNQEIFTDVCPERQFRIADDPWRTRSIFTFDRIREIPDIVLLPPLPTLWQVAAGFARPKAWKNGKTFDLKAAHGSVEEAIEHNALLGVPFRREDGRALDWHIYSSTVNYTGGAAPGSVDFAAISHVQPFEAGVAMRQIYSDFRRPVLLDLSTQAFAGTMNLTVYLNGQIVYCGLITGEPKKRKTVDGVLQSGWNTLAFTLDHVTWQMQCSVELRPAPGNSLAGLRFSPDRRCTTPEWKWGF